MRLKSPRKDAQDAIIEPGDMLIFAAGHAPILGTQTLYFRDDALALSFNATGKVDLPLIADITSIRELFSGSAEAGIEGWVWKDEARATEARSALQ